MQGAILSSALTHVIPEEYGEQKRDNIVQLYIYVNKKHIYVNQKYIRQPKIYVRQPKIYVR